MVVLISATSDLGPTQSANSGDYLASFSWNASELCELDFSALLRLYELKPVIKLRYLIYTNLRVRGYNFANTHTRGELPVRALEIGYTQLILPPASSLDFESRLFFCG